MATPATKHLSVRLPSATRQRLDIIAKETDRTLAQLVRYALIHFFEKPSSSLPLEEGERSQHLGVRIPADLADKVNSYAKAHKVTPSDVVRFALERWLRTAQVSALGRPRSGRR